MEEQEKYEVQKQSIDTALTTQGGLIPKNLEQLWRLAAIMARSGMMPKGIQTPEAVCVAIQMGLEVGLSPMQAVQNIAVINGRPSVWGDAGLALVESSGKLEDFKESIEQENGTLTATCWAKRKGRPTPVKRSFSMEDAAAAGLKGKEGPWQQYPKRMLQMRARWWVLRDLFADVLKGLKAAEEVQDYIDITPQAMKISGQIPADKTDNPYEVKTLPTDENEKQNGGGSDDQASQREHLDLEWTAFSQDVCKRLEIPIQILNEIVKIFAENDNKSSQEIRDLAIESDSNKSEFVAAVAEKYDEKYKNQPMTGEKPPESETEKIRDEYHNLKSSGFFTWFHKNKSRIPNMPEQNKAEIRDKFKRLAPNEDYPLDAPSGEVAAPNGQGSGESSQGNGRGNGVDYIPCPDTPTNSRRPVTVCQDCLLRNDCQPYQEYLYEENTSD